MYVAEGNLIERLNIHTLGLTLF
ncbi:hypothetical protein A2U01_0068375, partial [Trifolium medium]|nr:hypothetical protein [Trifolium medium]